MKVQASLTSNISPAYCHRGGWLKPRQEPVQCSSALYCAVPSTAFSSQLLPPSQVITHSGIPKSHLQHPVPELCLLSSSGTKDLPPRCPFCSQSGPTKASSAKLHPATSVLRGKGGRERAGGAKSLAKARCLGWGYFKAAATFGQPTQQAWPPQAAQAGQPPPSCHLQQPCAAARPAQGCPASLAAALDTSWLQDHSRHPRQFSRPPQDTERVAEPPSSGH